MSLSKLLEGSKGLNTSQIIHSMGDIEGARQDTARQMLNDRQLQLQTEALNREAESLSDRAPLQDFGVRTPGQGDTVDTVIREPGKAPKDEAAAKPGLKTTTTATAAGGQAGLKADAKDKTTEEKKEGGKIAWGGVLPDKIKMFENLGYDPDEQMPDETDAAYGIRKVARGVGDVLPNELAITAYGHAKRQASLNLRHWRETLVNPASGEDRIFGTNFPVLSTPNDRKKLGFKSDTEVDTFYNAVADNDEKINTWFAQRPGVMKMFTDELNPAEQIETIKYIIGKDGETNADTGLTEETKAEAKAIAGDIKKVKKGAGLPATSAIEEEAPSKKKNIRLVENPGKPRERWADTLRKREELAAVYQAKQDEYSKLVRIGTPAARAEAAAVKKEGELLRTEGLALESAAKKYEDMQALQDWRNSGDPRHLQGRLSEINDGETHIQPLDNGNYNILVRDAETGEFVVQHENVTEADISTSFQRRTDEDFDAAYQALIAQTRQSQMEFQEDVYLKQLEISGDIQKEIAKVKAAKAAGVDTDVHNIYLGGEQHSIIQNGDDFEILVPGVKGPGGTHGPVQRKPIAPDLAQALMALKGKQKETD